MNIELTFDEIKALQKLLRSETDEKLVSVCKKLYKAQCPHLVNMPDGTYGCLWSIHDPWCEECYTKYPRSNKENVNDMLLRKVKRIILNLPITVRNESLPISVSATKIPTDKCLISLYRQ